MLTLALVAPASLEEECGSGYTCTVDTRTQGGGEYGCAPIDNITDFVCCSGAQEGLPGIDKWCSDTDKTKLPFCPAGGATGGGCLREPPEVVEAAAVARLAPLKIYAAGSGHDMFSLPETAQEVMAMTGKAAPSVLYLGTATYDEPGAEHAQTQHFAGLGCHVEALRVAWRSPASNASLAASFDAADIVLVSGGNTLFARDRWSRLGIDDLIGRAAARGAVLAGGSAGGIVWFDGGHSDSMDATTYKNPPGPLLNPKLTDAQLQAAWAHSGEEGVAVDNWAALQLVGESYSLVSRRGKSGSVGPDGNFTSNFSAGHPGAWTLRVDAVTGALRRTAVPAAGSVGALLSRARFVVPSEQLAVARLQNPDDGKPAAWANRSGGATPRAARWQWL